MSAGPTFQLDNVEHEYTFRVNDAEPMRLVYHTRQVLPDRVAITVSKRAWSKVTVHGMVAKKDGTAGLSGHDAAYYPSDYYLEKMPAWLIKLANDVAAGAS